MDETLDALFDNVVRRYPRRVALELGDERLTYEELHARSERVAHQFRRLGLAPESLVVLLMKTSIARIIGILGIVKAGAACVPLTATDPDDRLRFMAEDCGGSTILVDRPNQGRLGLPSVREVLLEDQAIIDTIDAADVNGAWKPVTPRDLAFASYTSGSTGRPKAVLMEHGMLCDIMHASNRVLGVQPSDRWLLQWNRPAILFNGLLAGATLVLVPDSLPRSAAALGHYLDEKQISIAFMVPWFASRFEGCTFRALRLLVLAGEPVQPQIASRFPRNVVVMAWFGSSETSHVMATVVVPGERPLYTPLEGTRVHVLGPNQERLPVGAEGELCIESPRIARGYLNRPDDNRKKFITNPFGEGRLYRTGDLARQLPDGLLDLLGRSDHRSPLGWIRVTIEEIEAVLCEHPKVRQAGVHARDRRLFAFVEPAGPGTVPVAELRALAERRLPAAAVPTDFMEIAALPTTSNGKLDRSALDALCKL